MPLTDVTVLRAREEVNKKAFDDSNCFAVKPRWAVYSDSIHVDLKQHLNSAFDELLNILDKNDFLRSVTIWTSSCKQIKTTKHKRRLFWYGSDQVSRQRAKELLEKAIPYKK